MKKKRTAMAKRKPAVKPKAKSEIKTVTQVNEVKVRKIDLPPDGILRVAVPPAVIAVVAHDPIRNEVDIVPVPAKKAEDDKKTWLRTLFGG